MNQPAILAENIGKQYKIGLREKANKTLVESIAEVFGSPWQRLRTLGEKSTGDDLFWALRDVSFEMQPGEVLGIIGRNGAGKSTLLKILSRITEPTTGRAIVRGRVGSLLEVGAGFHPELTGRENIYLNGAILGMRKIEIDREFDEMVAFAETGKFLDTPIKRYSSGMRVRLGFAVAAHLDPEILIVDEVLAVGDHAFQKKCLGKMDDVSKSGRTVLFVSHNMGSIRRLCSRAMLLTEGTVSLTGDTDTVVDTYLSGFEQYATENLSDRTDRGGVGKVRVTGVEVSVPGASPETALTTGGPVRFLFRFDKLLRGMCCRFTIVDQQDYKVVHFNTSTTSSEDTADASLGNAYVCEVDQLTLAPGRYRMNVLILTGPELQDYVEAAAAFEVAPGTVGERFISGDTPAGAVCLAHRWTMGTVD
ncbi:MAG: polysaccharide ABC transporter ATP-binding protein [Candidatus Krumholzibacteria bacterium]|nr:polysaccharide ABC transporter ATP-binding protein [Candidatus Krumholzibacteria bacterium]